MRIPLSTQSRQSSPAQRTSPCQKMVPSAVLRRSVRKAASQQSAGEVMAGKTAKEAYLRDAYFAIELKSEALDGFRRGLKQTLESSGVTCEDAAPSVHVSIAYTQGEAGFEEVIEVANEIARDPFEVKVSGFEIIEGQCTPYDYLVFSLEASRAFEHAVDVVEDHWRVRQFHGGFKSHVSLLRFQKGSLAERAVKHLIRELNASSGAAFALGAKLSLEGENVCVFTSQRECCIQVGLRKAVPNHSRVA